MNVLVVIPAYNEEDNIERVVNHFIHTYPQYDYVVVNDGSNDNTVEICRKNNYHLLDLPINLGLSGAMQTGMRYALKKGYDAAIQIDGDGQHRPEYISQMIEVMEKESADIVIGSRFVTKRKPKSLRMLGSRIITFLIKLSTGYRMSDPTSGMRLYGKRVMHSFTYDMNCGPEPDTVSYLLKAGAVVKEIQVTMDERIAGKSYLNLFGSIRYMIQICFSIIFIQRFRKGENYANKS